MFTRKRNDGSEVDLSLRKAVEEEVHLTTPIDRVEPSAHILCALDGRFERAERLFESSLADEHQRTAIVGIRIGDARSVVSR